MFLEALPALSLGDRRHGERKKERKETKRLREGKRQPQEGLSREQERPEDNQSELGERRGNGKGR